MLANKKKKRRFVANDMVLDKTAQAIALYFGQQIGWLEQEDYFSGGSNFCVACMTGKNKNGKKKKC